MFIKPIITVFLFVNFIDEIIGKGVAVIGGKAKGTVCVECRKKSEIDPNDLKWGLIMLAVVASLFMLICFCRCYPKFQTVFVNNEPLPATNSRKASEVTTTMKPNLKPAERIVEP